MTRLGAVVLVLLLAYVGAISASTQDVSPLLTPLQPDDTRLDVNGLPAHWSEPERVKLWYEQNQPHKLRASAPTVPHWSDADSTYAQYLKFDPAHFQPQHIEHRPAGSSGVALFSDIGKTQSRQNREVGDGFDNFVDYYEEHDPMLASIKPDILAITRAIAQNVFEHEGMTPESGAKFFNHPFIQHLSAHHLVYSDGNVLPVGVVPEVEKLYLDQHKSDRSVSPRAPPYTFSTNVMALWYEHARNDVCTYIYDGSKCCGTNCNQHYGDIDPYTIGAIVNQPNDPVVEYYVRNLCGWFPYKKVYTTYCKKRKDKCTDTTTNCAGDGGSDCGPGVSGGYGDTSNTRLDLGYILDRPWCNSANPGGGSGCNAGGGRPLYKWYADTGTTIGKDKWVWPYATTVNAGGIPKPVPRNVDQQQGIIGYVCPDSYTTPV